MIMNNSEWLASLRQRQQRQRQLCERSSDRDLIAQVIDAGYRAMAKTMHPDAGGRIRI